LGTEGSPSLAGPEQGEAAAELVPAREPAAVTPEMSPAACAERLAALFPALFGGEGPPKPVKLRIHADIQQRAPGVFTRKALSIFMHRHTTGNAYLKALLTAPHRHDLDGQPAGEVAEEHRAAAKEELERRRQIALARRAAGRGPGAGRGRALGRAARVTRLGSPCRTLPARPTRHGRPGPRRPRAASGRAPGGRTSPARPAPPLRGRRVRAGARRAIAAPTTAPKTVSPTAPGAALSTPPSAGPAPGRSSGPNTGPTPDSRVDPLTTHVACSPSPLLPAPRTPPGASAPRCCAPTRPVR
jgi:sRNA-binding protein